MIRVTIVIRGLAHIPFATLDPRTNVLRALALHYSNIIQYLKQSGIEYSDYVLSEETNDDVIIVTFIALTAIIERLSAQSS